VVAQQPLCPIAFSSTGLSGAAHITAKDIARSILRPTTTAKASPWTLCKREDLVADVYSPNHLLLVSSHHYLTLLLGGKLYLAPIKDDVQVRPYVSSELLLVADTEPRCLESR
jgi:hypothetical protein